MKRKLITLIITLLSTTIAQASTNVKTIGILVPIEVPAMQEIVAGFQAEIAKQYSGKVNYIIKNAQGDPNLQRAILQQFQTQNIDLVAPIGTSSTQAAIATLRNKPILGIAAEVNQQQLSKANNPNVTNVLDQISISQQMNFIHQALPTIKQLSLVYSPSDNIFPEVQEANTAAQANKMSIQKLMIQQLSDLYSVSQQVSKNSQGIFILKDVLVVSGVPTLAAQAKKLQMPLIASDDGSVQKGAAFALGVSERQIGVDSGDLAAKILQGTPAKNIPSYIMKEYVVFVNPNAAKSQGLDLSPILAAAKSDHYQVITFNN